jgi:hypothetical protein
MLNVPTLIWPNGSGPKYVFASWEDGSTNPIRNVVAPGVDTTYTATYQEQVFVVTGVDGDGIDSISIGNGYYDVGSLLPVSATPSQCSALTGWTVTNGLVPTTFGPQTNSIPIGPTTDKIVGNFSSPQLVMASKGPLQTISGNPVLYQQSVSVVNSTSANADVSIVIAGLGAGVSVVTPSVPSGMTTSCTDSAPTTQQASFSVPAVGSYFPYGVAIDGDTMVVSSPNTSGLAVNVFVRNGSTWINQASLVPPSGGNFGNSVGISGDTLVVSGINATATYVFARSGTTWTQQAVLPFSSAVAISGDTLVTGGFSSSHVANVFARSGTNWIQQATLQLPVSADGTIAVATNGNTVVVGQPISTFDSSGTGAVYLFVGNGSAWTQQAVLTAGASEPYFGSGVAIGADNTVVVSSGQYLAGGALHIYAGNGSTWTQQALLTGIATTPDMLADFGSSVAIDGNTLVASNPYDGGESYVYTRVGTSWIPQAILAGGPGLTSSSSQTSVAISGGTLALNVRGSAEVFQLSPRITGGATSSHAPYYTVPNVAPGATASVTLQFTAPSPASILYNASGVVGAGPR